jgi:hypothetical protein
VHKYVKQPEGKMKKGIFSMLVVVSVFVYGIAMAGVNNPPSAPVTVENTSSNPVPVTGNLGISGTANVNITNTVPVSITNTPVPVTTGVQEPVHIYGYCETGGLACPSPVLYTVPTGKRLVVEYFSCNSYIDGAFVETGGYTMTCQLQSPVGELFLPTSTPAPTGLKHVAMGQQVRFYVPENNFIMGMAFINRMPEDEHFVLYNIIGYLENTQ